MREKIKIEKGRREMTEKIKERRKERRERERVNREDT